MSCAVNTTNLVNVGCPTMPGTDIPRQLADGGQYDPILRLAQVQIQPPRNPNKPLTPFSIVDILNSGADEMHNIRRKHQRHSHHYRQQQQQQLQHQQQEPTSIKRPWDDGSCKSAGFSTDFDDDDDYDDDDDVDDRDDEEIDVVDEVNSKKGLGGCKAVCPLDALLKMASKAFDSRSAENLSDENDKLDQTMANGISKSHNSKKRRKSRTAFTNKQIYELEKRFLYQKYLTPVDRDEIAQSLGLSNAQVITWFQNRRAKLKRDMEELKADVIAAKALGKEPTSALIGGIEELLNGTKDALKRKPQKQQQIPTTNIPNDAHSNDSNASSLPVSDNSRGTSHDSSDMHQSCHSDGTGSARRDSAGPDIE